MSEPTEHAIAERVPCGLKPEPFCLAGNGLYCDGCSPERNGTRWVITDVRVEPFVTCSTPALRTGEWREVTP